MVKQSKQNEEIQQVAKDLSTLLSEVIFEKREDIESDKELQHIIYIHTIQYIHDNKSSILECCKSKRNCMKFW
jgi:hypothetical protein